MDEASFPDLMQSGSMDTKRFKEILKQDGDAQHKSPDEKSLSSTTNLSYDYADDKFLMPGLKGTLAMGYRNFIGKGVSGTPPPPPPMRFNRSPFRYEQRNNRGQRKGTLGGSISNV